MQPDELRDVVQQWMRTHPGIFEMHLEPAGIRLVDAAAGKPLTLEAEEVTDVKAHHNWATNAEYLLVQRSEHPPLALADAGFVFALDTRNTGPLQGAPSGMSFRDYRKLRAHLEHLTQEQQDPQRRREALDLSMILIASLDGARASGLPTHAEESDLDTCIRRLEAGA